MARKLTPTGYTVEYVKKSKYGWVSTEYIRNFDTKEQALIWIYKNVRSKPMSIAKEWADEDGELYTKPYGVAKETKRVSGRAVIFYREDEYGNGYTADLTAKGTLKNKR